MKRLKFKAYLSMVDKLNFNLYYIYIKEEFDGKIIFK